MAEKIESLQDIKAAAKSEAAETVVRKAKKDKFGRSYATGKRKDAVARVWIKAGKGNITINEPTSVIKGAYHDGYVTYTTCTENK